MPDLYPSLKPLKTAQPKSDKQRKWVLPGAVSYATYNRKQLTTLFRKEKRVS